ncbi:DUF5692 family protein [Cognataquiflexum aquatile]|uniref:DUF5692 family protein n=1 Tax=Cognataquiflexum aquatile TaxID=2249427 RepID=UPI000DEB17F5|nr:DUF5692 family protein [Cognataquiflexum aquatile]
MRKSTSFHWLQNLLKPMLFLLLFGGIISPLIAQERASLEGKYAVTRSDNQVFIFSFSKDGTVIVTKKNSEDKDFKEKQKYELNGDKLTITPIWPPSVIDDFNDVTMTKAGEGLFTFSKDGLDYEVQEHSNVPAIIHVSAVLIVLLIFNYLCRWSKWFVWATCVILPLYLTIYVWPITTVGTAVDTWFHVAKVWSALAGSVFFTLVRFTKLNNYKWAKFVVAAILAINIVEAVMRDFELGTGFGGIYHYLNGTAGILCIITLSGWLTIKADDSKFKDMVWPDMTLLWIIAYDVWNWSYICNCIPEHGVMGLIVLLSCTIPAFYKVGTWLQARAYTLSAYMMYIMSGSKWISHPLNNVLLPDDPTFIIILAMLSLGLNVYNAYVHFGMMIRRKAWGFGQPVLTLAEQEAIVATNKTFPHFIKMA